MESFNSCMYSLSLLFLLLGSATAGGDFIRSGCSKTLYPDLCYNTLSPYTNSIKNNNAKLAETAITVSLEKSTAAAAFIARKMALMNSNAVVPMEDCLSTLKDAASQARDSLKQMKKIVGKPVESVGLEVSNVQTWMSAALTNQGTCIDGLAEVEDGVGNAEVVKRAEVAKKVTSNALAFIVKYANNA